MTIPCEGVGHHPAMHDLDHQGRGVCPKCRRTYRLTWNGLVPTHTATYFEEVT